MQIKSIKKIVPELSRCIEVDSPDRLFASGGPDGVTFVSHNSVVQRNIIFATIMRPDRWRFLGIDLKKVELSGFRAYSNVVLGIATELPDALTVLRFAQETMMKRYSEFEQLGLNNFLDLPDPGQALMVMVDEAGELLGSSGVKTDEGKAMDELKGEAAMIIGSIARLGRAAGVHLVIATQRPDATLIAGETKANLGVRINCGNSGATASSMILDNSEGTRVKANPRGRLYLKIYNSGDHGQGFFAESNWIDEWLESKGLNPDGTPLTGKKSRLANIVDMNEFAEGTLDEKEGHDNQEHINKIRAEEAGDSADLEEDSEDYFEKVSEEFSESQGESEPLDSMEEDGEDIILDEVEEEPSSSNSSKIDRPELTGEPVGGADFGRPEDDWDEDLESLIDSNRG